MRILLPLLVLSVACASPPPEPPPLPQPPDLDDPEQAALAFLRARASLDPMAEVFYHWSGTIHEVRTDADQARREPLLRFEGFNVARAVPRDGGWRVLSREITLYQDAEGRVIDCWVDPSAPPEAPPRPVVHVQNDPVNFGLRAPAHALLDDRVVWSVTVPLAYPSPLTLAEHPAHVADDTYRSVELFDFEVGLEDLAAETTSVPTRITWTRMGQWLPWMGRGQQPGWLVYHATGRKLPGGWSDLPEALRAWVLEQAPEYQHAPETDEGPNQTSWSVFRDALEAGAVPETCAPVE